MSDLNTWIIGLLLVIIVADTLWAIALDFRVRNLEGQLAVKDQEEKDAAIITKKHTLTDLDLNNELAKDLKG